MRVMLVHNFYGSASPSGENISYLAERDLLIKRGVHVDEFVRNSDGIRSLGTLGALIGGVLTPWNMQAAFRFRDLVKKLTPDIVHVHNTFPLISPSIFWSIRDLPCAVVLTLHNYRLFCANGMPLRDSNICTLCIDSRSVIPSLRHACYRSSAIATVPLATSIALHRGLGTWNKCIDAFIALTQYQRGLVVEAGLPPSRTHVKPHFLGGDPTVLPWGEREDLAIFIGRLKSEKGPAILLRAWSLLGESAPALDIIGDGPDRERLEAEIERLGLKKVRLLGQLSFEETQERLARSKLLLVPSTWFEGFPMVIREAFAYGIPVAASRIGALVELIDDGVNGVLFRPNDAEDLAAQVSRVWNAPAALEQMAGKARERYSQFYTEGINFEILLSIYDHAKSARKERR